MSAIGRRLVEAGLAVICAGSLYQLVVGLELLDLGDSPGEGPPLDGLFFRLPVWVLLVGGSALVLVALMRRSAVALSSVWSFQALAVAAAAFPLCRSAAFDPYYLPALLRFRGVDLVWLLALLAVAVLTSLLCRRRPGSLAVAATGAVMVASGLVAIGEGLH
jgi:hypothetical protein